MFWVRVHRRKYVVYSQFPCLVEAGSVAETPSKLSLELWKTDYCDQNTTNNMRSLNRTKDDLLFNRLRSKRLKLVRKRLTKRKKSSYLSSYSADIITKEENVAQMYYIRRRKTQRSLFIAGKRLHSYLTPPPSVCDWFTGVSLECGHCPGANEWWCSLIQRAGQRGGAARRVI